METYQGFATEVTPAEQSAGFAKVLIANPSFVYHSHASNVPAVVRTIGPADIVIKVVDPDGRVEYTHKAFGTLNRTLRRGKPEWMPIGTGANPDMHQAVRAALSGADQQFTPFSVQLSSGSMKFACVDCGEFEVESYTVPFDANVTCPKCNKSLPAKDSPAYKM